MTAIVLSQRTTLINCCAAIAEYLSRRAELERRFEVDVPRRPGDNVEAGIRRIMS
jgi:hypothetical protein